MRWLRLTSVTVAGAVGFLGMATTSAPTTAGTLSLQAALPVVSTPSSCPPEAPPDVAECRIRTGQALVAGLGSVSENYNFFWKWGPPSCPSNGAKPLATTARLIVAKKGELHFALAEGARCVPEQDLVRTEPQDFTITGGTGIYAGASGSGAVERVLNFGSGTEKWVGTLVVPGVEFDVTPPRLSGATSKTVRAPRGAKSVRVTYRVTARDEVDGALSVACQPRSGSRFFIGRTVVTCEAADTSANTRRARFRVTVKPAR
jgi:hypothetical protein